MPRNKTQEASMTAASMESTDDKMGAGGGQDEILREIKKLKAELLSKIDEKVETQATEIRNQCEQLREEFINAMDQANIKTTALEAWMFSMEEARNDHSDAITSLQQEVAQLKRDVTNLEQKNEDLEARSHRCNLHIIGVKERRDVPEFVSQLLKNALGLDKAPLLDRAHRTLRERPGDDQPARALVVRCHYFQECELLIKKAIQKKEIVTSAGDRIRIQPDYTQRIIKQRAPFNEVRGKLRRFKGVCYSLFYPVELRITTKDGARRSFKDAKLAMEFVKGNLKS